MAEKRGAQAKSGYHHGDLRNGIIERSLVLLEDKGVDGLSLRVVASDLGVSQPAFYHHFASRDELLAALAVRGFEVLASGLRNIPPRAEAEAEAEHILADGIAMLMTGYLRFARKRPHLFRVMFSRNAARYADHPDLKRAAGDSYRNLARQVSSLLAAAGVESEAGHATATIWSIEHGLASLVLGGGMSSEVADVLADADGLIRESAETLAVGLVARASSRKAGRIPAPR
jgi:AcrR family transcriptional regulator